MRTLEAPGIEELIIKGTEDKLSKYFGVSKTYFISSTDRFARMKVIAQNKDIKFPIAFMTLATGAIEATYNSGSMRRHGTYTHVNGDGNSIGRSYMIPVLMTCSVVLVTDTFAQALKFFKLWLLGARANSLNFDVQYDSLPVSIRVDMDISLTIPQRDVTIDTQNFYEFESQLNIHGYVSPDNVQQVPTLDQINTSLALITPAGQDADAEHDAYIPTDPVAVPDDPTLLDSSGEHHKDYTDDTGKRHKVHDAESID